MVAKALRRVKANATMITSAIPVSKVLRRSRNPSTSTAVSRPPDEFDQAGAQQIANAVHVGHDARHQRSGLVRVEVCDGQTANVGLHLGAQFGDQALAGLGNQLRDGETRDALYDGGGQNGQHQGSQQRQLALADDIVDQIFG